eukprot:3941663-Rhodomonas_salina.1
MPMNLGQAIPRPQYRVPGIRESVLFKCQVQQTLSKACHVIPAIAGSRHTHFLGTQGIKNTRRTRVPRLDVTRGDIPTWLRYLGTWVGTSHGSSSSTTTTSNANIVCPPVGRIPTCKTLRLRPV